MAAIGLVDVFGAPTAAQSADIVAELVSVDADGGALGGSNTRPSVADDGKTVVFTNLSPVVDDEAGLYDLVIRRRSSEATAVFSRLAVASSTPLNAAISGDGCTVAYSVVVPDPDEGASAGAAPDGTEGSAGGGAAEALPAPADVIELRVVDLCGATGIDPVTTVLDRVERDTSGPIAALSAPALNVDGSIVAFPTRPSVLLYSADSTPEQRAVVSIPAPGGGLFVGDHLDLTADGATVVFEAGPLSADPDDDIDALDLSVYLATIAAPVDDAEPVVTAQLFAPSDAGSSWPSISADGALVAYQSDQPLPIEGIPDDGGYVVIAERDDLATTHRLLSADAARPDLAANGQAIAYDVFGSVQVRRSESAVPFEDFSERIVNVRVDVDFVEGAGDSVSGVALSGDATSVVFDQAAGAALSTPAPPGAHVWAQATSPLFAPPPTTTTTIAATTTIDTTTTTTTTGVSTSTIAPTTTRNTSRTTTQNTTATTTRSTSRTTIRNSSGNTSTTPGSSAAAPSQPVGFSPAAFEFAPTIINAGRRSAVVDLTNPTARSVTVISVTGAAEGATDFTIDSAACTVLAAGATCPVNISFAPTATGERTTTVVATLSDGSTASIALRGLGAPEPRLDVLPGVASNGQVVAVIGAGFPAGAAVEFRWNDEVAASSIVIDEAGGFAETRVVLPNTAGGPVELSVAGQAELFGDVTTTLLVSDTSSRGDTAVLGGGITGASLGR